MTTRRQVVLGLMDELVPCCHDIIHCISQVVKDDKTSHMDELVPCCHDITHCISQVVRDDKIRQVVLGLIDELP
jgi:hypothetical protein